MTPQIVNKFLFLELKLLQFINHNIAKLGVFIVQGYAFLQVNSLGRKIQLSLEKVKLWEVCLKSKRVGHFHTSFFSE